VTWKGWEDYVPPTGTNKAIAVEAPAPKRSKYGAQACYVLPNGLLLPADSAPPAGAQRFDSKREAMRFLELMQELEQGRISGLRLQEPFTLHTVTPEGVKVPVGRYIVDFEYVRDGKRVLEDAKGVKTAIYSWKRRHTEAEYGVQIVEV